MQFTKDEKRVLKYAFRIFIAIKKEELGKYFRKKEILFSKNLKSKLEIWSPTKIRKTQYTESHKGGLK